MLIEVRSDMPGTVVKVEEENHAVADMYKEANLPAASVETVSMESYIT